MKAMLLLLLAVSFLWSVELPTSSSFAVMAMPQRALAFERLVDAMLATDISLDDDEETATKFGQLCRAIKDLGPMPVTANASVRMGRVAERATDVESGRIRPVWGLVWQILSRDWIRENVTGLSRDQLADLILGQFDRSATPLLHFAAVAPLVPSPFPPGREERVRALCRGPQASWMVQDAGASTMRRIWASPSYAPTEDLLAVMVRDAGPGLRHMMGWSGMSTYLGLNSPRIDEYLAEMRADNRSNVACVYGGEILRVRTGEAAQRLGEATISYLETRLPVATARIGADLADLIRTWSGSPWAGRKRLNVDDMAVFNAMKPRLAALADRAKVLLVTISGQGKEEERDEAKDAIKDLEKAVAMLKAMP